MSSRKDKHRTQHKGKWKKRVCFANMLLGYMIIVIPSGVLDTLNMFGYMVKFCRTNMWTIY